MSTISRIILSTILIGSGIAVIIFAVLLAFPIRDWIEVGSAVVILLIGGLIGVSGVRIALGTSIREVLEDLFISLGR